MNRTQEELSAQKCNKNYEQALEAANIAAWLWNQEKNIFYITEMFEKITGHPSKKHMNLYEVIQYFAIEEDKISASNDLAFFLEGRTSFYRSVFRIRTKENGLIWMQWSGNRKKSDGNNSATLFGVVFEVTEEKERERSYSKKMYYDSLTSLPNRDLFRIHLKSFLSSAIHQKKQGAVIFVDLDNFKSINDTLGHDYGDLMLKVFSQLISVCVKNYGEVYRLGGDEFIVIIRQYNTEAQIKEFCDNLLEDCKKPFELMDKQVYITTSIGISVFPKDSIDINELLKFADLAMYQSKSSGKNCYTFFKESISKSYERAILIENQLKNAIQNQELSIVYQPQVNAYENKVVSFEALLRWENETLGCVSPVEFIPIAEKCGIITEIGDWVIDKVCEKMRMCREHKQSLQSIAINVSPIQMKTSNFMDKIIKACDAHNIPYHSLEIEITEGTLIDLYEEKTIDLTELIQKGFHISVDDFGTGYSSLSYLTILPIQTLKIDKSFIDHIEEPKNRAVIECILNLSKALKYNVIAEGVETKEQLDILTDLGCNMIQGYYFYKPMKEEEMEELLNER